MQGIRERFSFMRGNMLVLTVRQILGNFSRRMVMPYASLYVLAVGGESSQIGVINSLRPLAGLVMFPLSGYLTDRRGRVRLIAMAGYLSAATMLLYVLAQSWEWLALGALIQGFMVFQFPPSSAILADSLEPENRGMGISTMSSLAAAFGLFSPYIAGLILEFYGTNFGMRVLYGVLLASQVLNAIIVQRWLRDTTTSVSTDEMPSLVEILRGTYGALPALFRQMPRSVKALGAAVATGFLANAIASPFWVVYAVEEIGLSNVDWGLILLLETISMMVLAIPAGAIADRYGRTRSILFALVVTMVSLPSYVLARGFFDVLLIRLASSVANVLFMPASTALMADHVPRELRGRVMAAIGRGSYMIGATGGGTGGPGMGYLFIIPVMAASISGGVLYTINPAYPWLCVLVATLVQVILVVLFIRDTISRE
ncbi:MAG: MFS transporter [Candidatus Bathyarchaeota archaeon]|nr:MAG: MFS transporter [Candidatus Bathyarchaeota archaeon]